MPLPERVKKNFRCKDKDRERIRKIMVGHKNGIYHWKKRNWLSLAIIGFLSWVGVFYWKVLLNVSPYLVIVHSFLLYLFAVKLLADNYSSFDKLFARIRDGGWVMIETLVNAIKRKRKQETEQLQKKLNMDDLVVNNTVATVSTDEEREQIPPYAKYGPILMEYLEQVRWERFTITQAQLILHKRFGTVKLVLEELVHQQKLEYVRTGKRVAYRPINYGK